MGSFVGWLKSGSSGAVTGAVGALLMVAATSGDARNTIGAAHDITTRHGEIAVRVDAGGADVTALAAVDPGTAGQMLTVSDAGLPHWAAAAGGSSLPDAAGVADGAVLAQIAGAQAWTALGPPTTLAAQARAETLRRRGPLALRSTGSSGTASTGATSDATPTLVYGSTWIVVAYASQAGSFASSYLLFSGANATRGYFLAVSSGTGGDDLLVRSMASTGNVDTFLPGFLSTIGWHAVAFAVAADGNSVRYSIDGAAVTTATPATTPWPLTSRLVTDAVYIGTDNATAGTAVGVAYIATWSSVLADDDLVALSSSPSMGAPTLPSAPAWEWAAAAFAGANAVTLDGVVHAITGTPQVWMP